MDRLGNSGNSPFVFDFSSLSSKSVSSTSLENLLKFVLQKNCNFVDFLLGFYSLVKASLQQNIELDEVIKFRELSMCLDKNTPIYPSDVIEQLGAIKEGKPLVKEYNSNFKYDLEVFEELKNLVPLIGLKAQARVLNLYSGLGILSQMVCTNLNYTHSQIDSYDPNEKLNEFNRLINSNTKIVTTDILHGNDIDGQYDLVITDIPENIKNIIYAKLCSKIKELKIRGTKSEPLIIQLISQLLKPNGSAIVIVSNGFLFGDSKQHVETRKFIYENSSKVHIISLSNKKSILFWTKDSGLAKSLNLTFKNSSGVLVTVCDAQVKESGYSFYHSNYGLGVSSPSNPCNLSNSSSWVLGSLMNVMPCGSSTPNQVNQVLYSYSNSNFAIGFLPEKYDYAFVTRDENIFKQEYLNYYLLDYFKSNVDLITKGKTKILCLDKINNLAIDKKSIEEQNNIISFIVTNEQIENLIKKQMLNIGKIKSNTLNSLVSPTDKVKLSSVATISNQTDGVDSVGIYKNSSQAGKVFKVSEPLKSDNIYFISPIDNDTSVDFLYNYLLDKQDQLISLAKINNTVSLSRKSIESFEVPGIVSAEQNKINEIMEQFKSLEGSLTASLANTKIFNILSSSP